MLLAYARSLVYAILNIDCASKVTHLCVGERYLLSERQKFEYISNFLSVRTTLVFPRFVVIRLLARQFHGIRHIYVYA